MTVVWEAEKVIRGVNAATEAAEKESAEAVAKAAKSFVHVDTGEIKEAITVFKSQYKNGGYIIGVFDDQAKNFNESLGLAAISLEYGHALPKQGRSTRKKKDIVKSVAPRPFLRPALNASKGVIMSSYHNRVK